MNWQEGFRDKHINPESNTTPTFSTTAWPSTSSTDWPLPLVPEAPRWPQLSNGDPATVMQAGSITAHTEETPGAHFGSVSMWNEWDNFNTTGPNPTPTTATAPRFRRPVRPPPVSQASSGPITQPIFTTALPLATSLVSPSSFGYPGQGGQEHQSPIRTASSSLSPSAGYFPHLVLPVQVQAPTIRVTSPPRKRVSKSEKKKRYSTSSTRRSSASVTSPSIPSPSRQQARKKTSTSNVTAPAASYSTEGTTSPLSSSKARTRGQTEQKYRARMNDQFSALLDSIPKELVDCIGGGIGRESPHKPVSKIDVLDLAQRHINLLEKELAALKGERTVLDAQIDFLQKMFVGMGGVLMP